MFLKTYFFQLISHNIVDIHKIHIFQFISFNLKQKNTGISISANIL